MRPALCFPLTEVLDLAEHAAGAPHYASPVADEPDGPALLLVADDCICLRSNGLPPLPPTAGDACVHAVRAVHAEGYPAGTHWLARVHATGSEQALLVGLRLRDGYRVLDQLREAAGRGFTTLTVHLHSGGLRIGVCRRQPINTGW